jgi:hypothetical protein
MPSPQSDERVGVPELVRLKVPEPEPVPERVPEPLLVPELVQVPEAEPELEPEELPEPVPLAVGAREGEGLEVPARAKATKLRRRKRQTAVLIILDGGELSEKIGGGWVVVLPGLALSGGRWEGWRSGGRRRCLGS